MESDTDTPDDRPQAAAPCYLSYHEVDEGNPSRTGREPLDTVFVLGESLPALSTVVPPPPPTLLGLMSLADLTAWGDPQLLNQEVRDRGRRR